jgi:hypothetical protein
MKLCTHITRLLVYYIQVPPPKLRPNYVFRFWYGVNKYVEYKFVLNIIEGICPCLIRASLLTTLHFRLVHLILDKKKLNTQSLLQHITSKNNSNIFT